MRFGLRSLGIPEIIITIDVACRGQKRGSVKHGVGAYKYPSGATYDGEWVNNLKQGQGIFRFARVTPLYCTSMQKISVLHCLHEHFLQQPLWFALQIFTGIITNQSAGV